MHTGKPNVRLEVTIKELNTYSLNVSLYLWFEDLRIWDMYLNKLHALFYSKVILSRKYRVALVFNGSSCSLRSYVCKQTVTSTAIQMIRMSLGLIRGALRHDLLDAFEKAELCFLFSQIRQVRLNEMAVTLWRTREKGPSFEVWTCFNFYKDDGKIYYR